VCSLARIRNEGTYPHRDIGEVLVREGDLGYVHESWSFLDEVYYTVEFVRHAVVVVMRGKEMAKIGPGAA
jgi:nitrogen fixation protein NifZ